MNIKTEISDFIDNLSRKTKVPNFISNDFSNFDPEKSKYNTVSTNQIHITVKPGIKDDKLNLVQPKSESSQRNGSSVSILARDILPIHTRLEDFKTVEFDNTDRVVFAIGMLTPIFIYIFAAGYIRYNHRIKDDTSYSQSRFISRVPAS